MTHNDNILIIIFYCTMVTSLYYIIYHLHFIDENTETHIGILTCLTSQS